MADRKYASGIVEKCFVSGGKNLELSLQIGTKSFFIPISTENYKDVQLCRNLKRGDKVIYLADEERRIERLFIQMYPKES